MGVNILGLWRAHRMLLIAFLVGLALTGFFLVRTVVSTVYWADPAHYEQTIEGWMPVRYVARSWDVPPKVLEEALDLRTEEGRRLTIAEIAAERGVSVDQIAGRLRTAIMTYRETGDD
ncbi:MAG TPA: hypothetical protein ENH55_19115 [Aurantimonas coralicida]|uniref:Uncharacterized protein n=2 Tax=root TaxID=1 RepID=A0A9C9TGS1_9HYPH|nr:hypothetical protein [Aurantimonas coralicida]HEU00048.1 hypothetical protein [Aurantimonas coralicida]